MDERFGTGIFRSDSKAECIVSLEKLTKIFSTEVSIITRLMKKDELTRKRIIIFPDSQAESRILRHSERL